MSVVIEFIDLPPTTNNEPLTKRMSDQAEKLRALIHTAAPVAEAAGGELPMIVVSGGRAGVGTTTVALNLAAVLADRGERVLLVDGAQQRNDVIEPAGVRWDGQHSLFDVLSGKCAASEAIVRGPAGIQMLPSRWNRRTSPDFSRHAQQRLLTELQTLDLDFDLIVVDAGRGATTWTRRFWSRAKLIALVTTPDDAAVLDAYAAMKAGAADAVRLPLRLLVNRADSDAAADDAYRRMDNACQRFLSRSIPALPALPRCDSDVVTGARFAPRVWELPNSPFGHAALWLGRAVSDVLAVGTGSVGQAVPDEFLLTVSGTA